MKQVYTNLYTDVSAKDVQGNQFTVGFDMDSVLNEMGDNLGSFISREFKTPHIHGRELESGARLFHFNVLGVGSGEMHRVVNKYVTKESMNDSPSPHMGAVTEYVYHLTKVPICVVTARPSCHAKVTYKWLLRNMPVPFVCYMVPSHSGKADVLLELRTRLYVEDRYRTVTELENILDYAVLYRRPWNQGRSYQPGAFAINDLRDIIPVVNILHGKNPMNWVSTIPYPEPLEDRRKRYVTVANGQCGGL